MSSCTSIVLLALLALGASSLGIDFGIGAKLGRLMGSTDSRGVESRPLTGSIPLDPAFGLANARSIGISETTRSDRARNGFMNENRVDDQLVGDDYRHRGIARGGSMLEKQSSALIGGPMSQGSKDGAYRTRADTSSSVTQSRQQLGNKERDYELGVNKEFANSRKGTLTDHGDVGPGASGVSVDLDEAGLDNTGLKSNRLSSANRISGQTIDVVNDRESGGGEHDVASLMAAPSHRARLC